MWDGDRFVSEIPARRRNRGGARACTLADAELMRRIKTESAFVDGRTWYEWRNHPAGFTHRVPRIVAANKADERNPSPRATYRNVGALTSSFAVGRTPTTVSAIARLPSPCILRHSAPMSDYRFFDRLHPDAAAERRAIIAG